MKKYLLLLFILSALICRAQLNPIDNLKFSRLPVMDSMRITVTYFSGGKDSTLKVRYDSVFAGALRYVLAHGGGGGNVSFTDTLSRTTIASNYWVDSTINAIFQYILVNTVQWTDTNTTIATKTDIINNEGWSLTGDTGTNSGTNFIGTTDNASFAIATNDTARVVVDSLGDFSMGDIPNNTGIFYAGATSAGISFNPIGLSIDIAGSFYTFGQPDPFTGYDGMTIDILSHLTTVEGGALVFSSNGASHYFGFDGSNIIHIANQNIDYSAPNAAGLWTNDGVGIISYTPTTGSGNIVTADAIPLWDTTQCLNGIHVHGITSCSPLNINADSIVSSGKISAPSLRISGLSTPNGKLANYDTNGNISAIATSALTGIAAGGITGLSAVATSGSYNDLSSKPTIPAASQFVKMAHATAVNGAALASTTLTYESGITLSGYIPTYAVIKYASGTLGICVAILNANSTASTASLPLSGLTSGNWAIMPVIPGVISNTGNLTIQVTTASLAASTFDIEIFGIQY